MSSYWCQKTSGRRSHWGAEWLCQADGVEPAPASATFCSSTFGSRFQTRCRLFTQTYKCFQNDPVKMVSTCLRKGSLVHWPCIMGFYWGRVTRRSMLEGSQVAEWGVVFCRQEEAYARVKMRRRPLFSAYLSLTYNTNTCISAEQTSTFTACACMCVCVCVCYICGALKTGRAFKPNVFSVILMTHSQINLELSVSSLTSQLGT